MRLNPVPVEDEDEDEDEDEEASGMLPWRRIYCGVLLHFC
jgi:hypothetical protein